LVESERRAREQADAERRAREKAQALVEAERLLREDAEARMRALSSGEREARDGNAARLQSQTHTPAVPAAAAPAPAPSADAASRSLPVEPALVVDPDALARAARQAIEDSERQSRLDQARFSRELDAQMTRANAEQSIGNARPSPSREAAGATRSPEAAIQAAREAHAREQAAALARQQTASAGLSAQHAKEEAQRRLLAEEEARRRAREAAEIASRARAEREKFERERQRKLAEAQAEAPVLAQDPARPEQPRPSRWKRYAGAIVLLLVTLVGLLEILPFNVYLHRVEKGLSDALGQPVAVKAMHASLIPRPSIRLSEVTIGSNASGAAIATVQAVPIVSSLFTGAIRFDSVRLDAVTVAQGFIPRLPDVVGIAGKQPLALRQVGIRNLRLDMPNLELPPADIDLVWNDDGSFGRAGIVAYDGRMTIDLTQVDGRLAFNMAATGWQPFPGSRATIDQIKVGGSATRDGLSATRVDAELYGGNAQGSATVAWGSQTPGASVRGDFLLRRLDVAAFLPAMTPDATAAGVMDGSMKFSMQAPTLHQLFDAPQVSAAFTIRRGWLGGIDVARLLRDPAHRGGRTVFDEWTGVYDMTAASHSLRQMRLTSGPMIATGSADVGADGRLTGRISAELVTGSGNAVRSSFSLGGTTRRIDVGN
jgi:hypothetical protein